MDKHPHADLMMQFAKDALTTYEPYKLWQYFDDDTDEWKDALCAPAWLTFRKYRRKPQTIRIGEFDIPEPIRVFPEKGTTYYVPAPNLSYLYEVFTWTDIGFDERLLNRGLVHLNEADAISHAKALISLTEADNGGF